MSDIADELENSAAMQIARLEAENQRLVQQLKLCLDGIVGDDPEAIPAEVHALQVENASLRAELATILKWSQLALNAMYRYDESLMISLVMNAPEAVRQGAESSD